MTTPRSTRIALFIGEGDVFTLFHRAQTLSVHSKAETRIGSKQLQVVDGYIIKKIKLLYYSYFNSQDSKMFKYEKKLTVTSTNLWIGIYVVYFDGKRNYI